MKHPNNMQVLCAQMALRSLNSKKSAAELKDAAAKKEKSKTQGQNKRARDYRARKKAEKVTSVVLDKLSTDITDFANENLISLAKLERSTTAADLQKAKAFKAYLQKQLIDSHTVYCT